ncbi:hypothetical protein ACEWY4_028077 [Coilia grayii]|uniref:Helitron helicase-like domain-containing protein n=1 Tax=Coilia grayii TaxID=363190 RepID=A0ABD1IMV4_9TELE
MVRSRHFKLKQMRYLKALNVIRCTNRIKRKYRNIMGFHETLINMETIEEPTLMSNPLIEEAVSLFRQNVRQGPTYICTVCHRCLFANQVRRCDSSKYSKDPELAAMCLTGTYVHVCEDSCTDKGECSMPERKEEWICYACDKNLKSKRLPSIAVANNLELDPIPEELQGLNVLERHVIAKFIPFAKIISLPKGQQRAIHGAVVCVPSEVDSTVQSLPRPPSESQLLRVKLKRRLCYKGHYQFQNLNMHKVQRALLKLKNIHSEYRDISLRVDDEDNYLEMTEFAKTENKDQGNADSGSDPPKNKEQGCACDDKNGDADDDSSESNKEDDCDSNSEEEAEQNDAEQDGNVAQQHAMAFDSCLQPADVGQELLSFGDNIYSIAPAEGNEPVSFFKTPKLESMAFPVQFCTGRNTIDEADRPRKISPSRYFNTRLFSVDNRFAMDTNYIFFAQFVTEMHLAMSSMSIQLRKGKILTKDGRRITTSLLKNQDEVQKLVRHGEATRFMQPLRGTPAFWEKTMKDLFAMLRQCGLPTFFVTFSAAEMRWTEIIEVIKRQQGEPVNANELDWTTKCDILRSNPVTVIQMFDKRVEALMRDLILSPAQPHW